MDEEENEEPVVALVGNPNVGKSTLFHQITGIGVTVSNYPGTTVEITKGKVDLHGQRFVLKDMPGVYSLGGTSEDEKVTRRAILEGDVGAVINVVDATNLERNLYLTLQLLELQVPTVVALNQYDRALDEGTEIDPDTLSEELGVPVIPTVATQGEQVHEAVEEALELRRRDEKPEEAPWMGKDLEDVIDELTETIDENLGADVGMPSRALALNLLEGDEELTEKVEQLEGGETVTEKARNLAEEIEKHHGEPAPYRIARERHGLADLVSEEATTRTETRVPLSERISRWTTQTTTGVPILITVFLGLLGLLFYGGGAIEVLLVGGWETNVEPGLRAFFQSVAPHEGVATVLDIGINLGIKGILAVMFPYILVFFLALAVLEDSGYLSRMAFVMDSAMHRLGLHGKAVVPMLGGFGCNVPAIMATRTLESRRQRTISSFLITMVPCSARTAVILGTVGAFAGIYPALAIYAIIIGLIFLTGYVLNKFVPGETTGMVMEMPPLRRPAPKPVLSKTWNRMREFLYIATPLLILGSLAIGTLEATGIMDAIVEPFTPLTLGLLGLPPVVIVPLIYGVIRKEGALVLLVAVAGTSDLSQFMTPLQLFVFALVVAIYIPCVATFAVLKKELGWRKAFSIGLATITLAVITGTAIFRLNPLGLAG